MTVELTEWETDVARIKDLAVSTIEIELPEDLRRAADRMIADEEWDEYGYLRIFATGLTFLRGERQLAHLSGDALDPATKADAERAVKQLMEESSRFAVLRFKAYRMAEDNQVLAMHENAWRADAEMLQQRVKRFREDEEALRTRIRTLEDENAALRLRLGADPDRTQAPAVAPRRSGLLATLLRRR
jgi:hypothetical protein